MTNFVPEEVTTTPPLLCPPKHFCPQHTWKGKRCHPKTALFLWCTRNTRERWLIVVSTNALISSDADSSVWERPSGEIWFSFSLERLRVRSLRTSRRTHRMPMVVWTTWSKKPYYQKRMSFPPRRRTQMIVACEFIAPIFVLLQTTIEGLSTQASS